MNLGARLRKVRLSSGLSLREVARQLGVSPSFVSQLETGKSQPSVGTLYALAQLLGISIDELFTEDPTVVAENPPAALVSPRRDASGQRDLAGLGSAPSRWARPATPGPLTASA